MRVLVCGGTGAIGSAIVRLFAMRGHQVSFTYAHSEAEAHGLQEETGGQSRCLDLLKEWSPPDVDPDVLIYNAGVNLSGHGLQDVTLGELRDSFTINVEGAVRLAQRY